MRWSRWGLSEPIFAALANEGPKSARIMIDAAHLKAHRTAGSMLKKDMFSAASGARKAA
jgi:putative transposase